MCRRKALQAEQGKADMEARIKQLEAEKKDLERQVQELKAKAEAIEKREGACRCRPVFVGYEGNDWAASLGMRGHH